MWRQWKQHGGGGSGAVVGGGSTPGPMSAPAPPTLNGGGGVRIDDATPIPDPDAALVESALTTLSTLDFPKPVDTQVFLTAGNALFLLYGSAGEVAFFKVPRLVQSPTEDGVTGVPCVNLISGTVGIIHHAAQRPGLPCEITCSVMACPQSLWRRMSLPSPLPRSLGRVGMCMCPLRAMAWTHRGTCRVIRLGLSYARSPCGLVPDVGRTRPAMRQDLRPCPRCRATPVSGDRRESAPVRTQDNPLFKTIHGKTAQLMVRHLGSPASSAPSAPPAELSSLELQVLGDGC
jgi:hypothetical protein